MKNLIYILWIWVAVAAASFEPYELNGGLICAIAGNDFVIVGCDTRMIGSGGYLLSSRNALSSRLWAVDDSTLMDEIELSLRSNDDDTSSPSKKRFESSRAPVIIGSSGCSSDCTALKKVIRGDVRAASHLGQTQSTQPDQIASLLSQTLYSRRGFPYYSFCCLGGMNKDGLGEVFVYDAIGSYEQVAVATAGTGRELLQSILDRFFHSISERRRVDCSAEKAVDQLVKAYRSVSEREIGVGDNLVLHVAKRGTNASTQCQVLVFPLKLH